jgi:hypothetical protein
MVQSGFVNKIGLMPLRIPQNSEFIGENIYAISQSHVTKSKNFS